MRKWDNPTHVKLSYGRRKVTKAYDVWRGMFERCYDKKYLAARPTYQECTVSEEWQNYDSFYEWFELNYKEGMCLDKDILVQGNKEYHPDKCCFVPNHINNIIVDHKSKRGDYPVGVTYHKRSGMFRAQGSKYGKFYSVGDYHTVEEAFEAYKTFKYDYVREAACVAYIKGDITYGVLTALLNWKIEGDE